MKINFLIKTNMKITSLYLFLFFWILATNQVFSQNQTVSGTIFTEDGETIIGATVIVNETKEGTATDADGRYQINATGNQTLTISFIGFTPQTLKINNRSTIDVVLVEDSKLLEEVVVVGYGTQLRRNVVGAVEHISGDVISDRPNAYVLRSLQGQVPGLNISMVDGKPSRSASLQIRGTTQSIGAGGSALCLIDGIEGDITAMNPEDIESISVLKDASSTAVYGARGAFGVILVTTKKAKKGKLSVNYSNNFAFYSPTVRPQYETDGEIWYDNFMTAYIASKHANPGGINNFFPWNSSWENEYKKRISDPGDSFDTWRINHSGRYEYFGNTDWYDMFYRKSTMGSQHNLSVSGGGEYASYIVSARYYEQDGIYRIGDEKFRQMNVRAKGTVYATDWLTIENSTDFVRRSYHQPMGYDRSLTIPRLLEHQGFPVTIPRNPDGSWTAAAVVTGYAGMYDGTTYRDNFKYDMKNSTFVTVNFFNNQLQAKGDFTYLYNHSRRIDVINPTRYNNGPEISAEFPVKSFMEHQEYDTEHYTSNMYLSYTPNMKGEHNLSVLGGVNIEEKHYKSTQMSRDGLISPSHPNFTLMDGLDYKLTANNHYSWNFMGLFYRLNYDYKSKYLFEVSGRYDGSSKFPQWQRWGFFPSVSTGWRISEEGFLANHDWIDNLKLRISAGTAGNGNVGPFQFMELMNIGRTDILIDGTKQTEASAPEITPESLTWESSATYDIGLDFDLFKGRLSFMGDVYRKNTTDMFVFGPEIPAVAGYSAPRGNYADLKTIGFETSIAWNDVFDVASKPFRYNLRLSIWDAKSTITKYTAKTNILPSIYSNSYYEGMELGEIWGYQVDGLFQTREEAEEWGRNAQASTFWSGDAMSWDAGDVRFADLDDDGLVNNGNNTLEDHGDLKKIGNQTPRFHYGITLGSNWNGIGVSIFLQGILKRDWYPAGESGFFWGQYNRAYGFSLPWQNESMWTEENPDPNAYWPRLRSYLSSTGRGTLRLPNDKYLQNAKYLRLKNITVDYSLPKELSQKAKLESVKFYISAENLFFWSPLKKHAKNFDPEQITPGDSDYRAARGTDGEGYGYPQTKSTSFGINISF